MKKDNILTTIVFTFTVILIFIVTRDFFLDFNSNYKYIGGFIKFFFLASIGDFIALRIKSHKWKVPTHIFIKGLVWGMIGVVIVAMFIIYPNGVELLQEKNILPFEGNDFFFALFVSITMNFTFAPVMMAFHRVSDTYLNMRIINKEVTIKEVINEINWRQFLNFTIVKTIPLFWIPAHTVTFLLPEEYRIIFAAILGIFLGLILGIFSNKNKNTLI